VLFRSSEGESLSKIYAVSIFGKKPVSGGSPAKAKRERTIGSFFVVGDERSDERLRGELRLSL
jgi:hypothetical protein